MSDGVVTVGQCVEGLPVGRFAWELLVCAFLAWFLLGAINESSPMAFSFIATEWTATQQSALLMSAALAFGNFLAILVGGWVADRHGRLAVIRPALLLTIGCGLLVQTAYAYPQALAARFVLGLASGAMLGVLPPLLAELLPSRNRGFYLTIWCSGWPAGALFSVIVGCLLPSLNWRAFYSILLVPAILLYICVRIDMLPESPRYLYMVGRREEGYNALQDMYEKENMPLPWMAETIGVACGGTPRGSSSSSAWKSVMSNDVAVTIWLSMTMLLLSAAAQSMKLWMPAMLVADKADDVGGRSHRDVVGVESMLLGSYSSGAYGSGADRLPRFAAGPRAASLLSLAHAPRMLPEPDYNVVLILSQAYIIQLIGVVVCAYASTWVHRKRMVQASLLAAGFFTLAALALAEVGALRLCGPLVGAQLAAQAAGLNFLQVFTCEYFPTASRAKNVAIVNFAAQLGNFSIPVLGEFVVQRTSPAGAIVFFSSLYALSWLLSLRLPLPTSREQPLLDVDDTKGQKDAGLRNRKSAWTSYQTI